MTAMIMAARSFCVLALLTAALLRAPVEARRCSSAVEPCTGLAQRRSAPLTPIAGLRRGRGAGPAAVLGMRGGANPPPPAPPSSGSTAHLALRTVGGVASELVVLAGITKGTDYFASRLDKPWGDRLRAVGMFAIVFFSGAITNLTPQPLQPTEPPSSDWYQALRKPSWTPPGFVFPIMWLLIAKPTQCAALVRLYTATGGSPPLLPLSVYLLHLALGDVWNQVFFGEKAIGFSVGVIFTFFAVLVSSAAAFASVDRTAGLLLLPTAGWVTTASILNLNIFLLNR